MNRKKIAISLLMIIALFVSAIAGTIYYYNGIINDRNSKINSLDSQIVNLNNEIANLSSKIGVFGLENLTSPNLATKLGATEIAGNPYNHLWISGTVTNTGEGTAFNAGLHVVASSVNGTIELNMTVPLNNNIVTNYGSGAVSSSAYIANGDNNPNYLLPSLAGGGTVVIGLNVFHEGTVANWTITPVWTNLP